MELEKRAEYYYIDENQNCAVSILMAASDCWDLGLSMEDAKLLKGFGGGMGCGSTCGTLAASIAVLGKRCGEREDFRELCARYVEKFKARLGENSGDCSVLAARYKTEEKRCLAVVLEAARLLGDFMAALA